MVITLAGAVAVFKLPVAQYPQITPPSIIVSCTYPGADARVVAESVAAPIEQQVNGVEDMLYMVSQSNNDGSYTLTVTFKPGVNQNFAQVLVQNRINLALPQLPDVVKQAGVSTRKRTPDILMVVALYSPHGRYGQVYLSNYANLKILDELARVEGVGDVHQFGSEDYSMRLWLDPERLAELGLTASDVVKAVREQNMQVAAGHIGQQPLAHGRPFELPITVVGRLTEPEQFADIILRSDAEGRKVRLRDVGHVEMNAKSRDTTSKVNGRFNASLAVFALPDANAIAVAGRIRDRMEQLKKAFPEDVDYVISLDMTPFITESIHEVFRTLTEAVILVAIVVLLFLQNWRSALIPLVAVPVAIIGTFAVMAAIGFSLNNLTMFGLVLAIGIVVDDAIVVVEAIEHHIEEGMQPRQAAHRAMEEVSGPVVAVALVLSAVFVPCAFITGITGQFFRQFALTIAVSTVLSAFNSLTLSPALAALLLPARGARKDLLSRLLDWSLGWFFRLFNWTFRRGTGLYTGVIGLALRGSAIVLLLYAGMVALTWYASVTLPTGYIPNQDQGRFYIAVQMPDAASLERTQEAMDRIQRIVQQQPGIVHTTEVAGQSFTLNANGSNFGNFFVTFKPFEERRDPSMSAAAIVGRIQALLDKEVPEAKVSLYTPPPVSGLGSASGFKIIIEDRGDLGLAELEKQVDRVIARSQESDKVEKLFSVFRANVPQLYADVNRAQCETMGVNPKDVFDTLQIYLGSYYVNDFNRFGRTWQVNIQAAGEFRTDPEKIKLLKVRNNLGQMVPLGSVLTIREIGGPINIGRYNMYTAAAILGSTKPGVSTGQGIEEMERICHEVLPPGMAFEWTEINYMQVDAAKNVWNNLIFPLAVVFVFLVLAAQYESWALPLAVILVVPMCILASLTGVWLTHGDINIFTQIGFVVLVGLASKNAILIVEFAKHKKEEGGLSRHEATLAAYRLRLRPILMTSFAFILGVVPLVLSEGAGAEMRRTLGTAVFAGMLGVTLFGIFLTP
ncbi:MAG TPA: multidrug efflux RND transporter permease subunit, partial [Gemmataceae bacterium]|nr:multidrug efflux RND transporter permease subunit [Gemmataceae bacterium]